MSLFSRERRAFTPSNQLGVMIDTGGFVRPEGWRATSLSITPEVALRHSVVNECVNMIANLAMLDVAAYRKVDGAWREGPSQRLLEDPSTTAEPIDWRRQVFHEWLTRGTAFGLVASVDRYQFPTQIELVDATRVELRQTGRFRWEWRLDGDIIRSWGDGGELWVAPGLHTRPGIPVGISPIEMACGAIGLGLAAEDFGASWFYDGAVPSSIITAETELTGEQAKTIKAAFKAALRGNREPAVFGSGLKYQQVSVAANESQFLDTLDKNAGTVARFFLVPPEEVGATGGDSMTYNNAETRALSLLSRTYQPWLSVFESRLTRLTQRPYKAMVQVEGLFRTDVKTRTEVDRSDVEAGIRTRNEVRATRGLEPLSGGDVLQTSAPKPDPMVARLADRVNDLAAREPTITVDARTEVHPPEVTVDARTHVDGSPVTVEPSPVTVDARTTVEPSPVDARTVFEAGAVDARTDVHPAEVRVDAPITVQPADVNVDARTTIEPPRPTRKVVERNKANDIIEIREEPV